MNHCVQQEIAAPKACKNSFLSIICISLVNFLIVGVFLTLLILKNNASLQGKYLTAPLFIGIITAASIVVAILLRKQTGLVLAALTLAAVDAAILLTYHYAVSSSGAMLVWQLVSIYLFFALLIFALLFLGIYYAKPHEKNPSAMRLTKYLTYCAMFTALSVICKMIGNAVTATIPVANAFIKLTVVYIPWVLGGIVLGPIGGFAAAAIGDFIGQLAVSTGGMPLPGLVVSNGLFAVFPAAIYKLAKIKHTYFRSLIAIVCGTILSAIFCTLGISTLTLYTTVYTGDAAFFAYLVTRLPQTVIIAINIALMAALAPALIRARVVRKPATVFFD